LTAEDRILVLGATGWFGQTTVALTQGLACESLLIASRSRAFQTVDQIVEVHAWDWNKVQSFAPTVVIDCAFLTRDYVSGMSLDEYVRRNVMLTERLLQAVSIDSVRLALTVSSGAAVYPRDALLSPISENPYGYLKREAEQQLERFGRERRIATVVARAWSVSGAFVLKPRSYAFSDLLLQALDGHIHIAAAKQVFRRYVAVEDLLSVAMASGRPGEHTVIDSGGQLVEMQDLAQAVVETVNPGATVSRPTLGGEGADKYYASPESWVAACERADFAPAGLRDQILVAQSGLTSRTTG
jgi:nucleoside-diphosphate-sugar epimerase